MDQPYPEEVACGWLETKKTKTKEGRVTPVRKSPLGLADPLGEVNGLTWLLRSQARCAQLHY
jgi:hypothetical protein